MPITLTWPHVTLTWQVGAELGDEGRGLGSEDLPSIQRVRVPCLLNAAACHIKLGGHEHLCKALAACEEVIKANPPAEKRAKAHFRSAQARAPPRGVPHTAPHGVPRSEPRSVACSVARSAPHGSEPMLHSVPHGTPHSSRAACPAAACRAACPAAWLTPCPAAWLTVRPQHTGGP